MVYEGIAGSVKIEKKTIAHMSDWSLELTREIKDGAYFGGDGYKEKKPGAKDWTASCNGAADFVTDTSQKELLDAWEKGTLIDASMYLDEKTYFSGKAYIESLKIDDNAEDGPNIEISLAGTKGITSTIPEVTEGN